MSLGIYYVIRHKATDEIMPELKGTRGYSWWNPRNKNSELDPKKILGVPRLLKSRKQAMQCITQWHTYPNSHMGFGPGDYPGAEEVDLKIKKDDRMREDLEVVEVLIVELIHNKNGIVEIKEEE